MTASDRNFYLLYLYTLLDQYNNTNQHSINKNILMLIILLWLKKLRSTLKFQSLKLIIELELLSIKMFLVKVAL